MDSRRKTSKLLWPKWYVKAAVAAGVVALLAVVWFVALEPTYTADEVTKKMQAYLRDRDERFDLSRLSPSASCYVEVWYLKRLATPHYIPYRKAWRITTVSSSDYTWLFDDRTGTIASSSGRC